jgi:hypothetical protein
MNAKDRRVVVIIMGKYVDFEFVMVIVTVPVCCSQFRVNYVALRFVPSAIMGLVIAVG